MEDQEIRAALDYHWAASDAKTSRGSTKFTERTPCSNILSRASACAGGRRFIVSCRTAEPETLHSAPGYRRGWPLGH